MPVSVPTAGAEAGFLRRLRLSLAEALARHEAFARTLRELSAMSDRDLADVGFRREDIRRIARESVYGA